MKLIPLLSLLLLSAVLVRADDSAPVPAKKKKKATKGGASVPANRAPVKATKKTGVEAGAQTTSHPGGSQITDGGESVLGTGIKRGNADKAPGATGSSGGAGGGGGGAAGGAATAPAKPANSFADIKVFTANSPNGPWVDGSAACTSGTVYTRTTGVSRTNPPKGCASPASNNGCLNYASHRAFLATEWVDNNTIQTVVNGASFPPGAYSIYLSYSAAEIARVGTMQLKSCAAAALTCGWTTPNFVVGPCGGPGCGNTPCTMANRGQQGQGGGGTWTCVCK